MGIMTAKLFNRYVWLLDLVSRHNGITFEEIDEAWQRSSLNDEGDPLPKRTLHNHINAIEEMVDVSIVCRRQGGYKYYIEGAEEGTTPEYKESIINQLRLSNALMGDSAAKGRVLLDKTLSHKYLNPLLRAMEESKRVVLVHPRKVDEEHTVQDRLHFEPYFIKQYREWFVVGRVVEEDVLRIFSFNHLAYIVPLEESFRLPEEFSPADFLDHIPSPEATPLDEREAFARYRAEDQRYHRSRIGGFVPDEVHYHRDPQK